MKYYANQKYVYNNKYRFFLLNHVRKWKKTREGKEMIFMKIDFPDLPSASKEKKKKLYCFLFILVIWETKALV